MAYRDLREFLQFLEKSRQLVRIREEVDPVLEITEITDRVSKSTGPALLFEKARGSRFPVVTNMLGSPGRMNMALGVDSLDQVADRISELLDFKSPEGLMAKLKMLPMLMDIGRFFPQLVSRGSCQEICLEGKDARLSELPVLQCWPGDGGRFITFPLVFTKNPQSQKRNCGIYRMQVYDDRTTGMHWQTHKHGADHCRDNRRLGRRMDVAVAIGADPVVCFAGALPAPADMDEMLLAGLLRQEPVEMVKCKTVNLEVPAASEFVLEGYVDPQELRREGPFGDHTGFYSLEDDYPVFHVQCITHRRDPLYLATVVGRPPMEDCHMGKAIERIFLPIMKKQLPEVADMCMPFEGVFHNLLLVSIRKSYPGQAQKIMNAIWGMGQAMFSKCIVVVDEDVDVQSPREVVWKVLNHIDPQRDILFTLGPVDDLDHASRLPHFGSKMGIDATRKWPGEGFSRAWPEEIHMTAEVVRRVDSLWSRLGLDGGGR